MLGLSDISSVSFAYPYTICYLMIIWVSCCHLFTQFWPDNTNALVDSRPPQTVFLSPWTYSFSSDPCLDKWHHSPQIGPCQVNVTLNSLSLNSHIQMVTISSMHPIHSIPRPLSSGHHCLFPRRLQWLENQSSFLPQSKPCFLLQPE